MAGVALSGRRRCSEAFSGDQRYSAVVGGITGSQKALGSGSQRWLAIVNGGRQ